LGGGGGSIPREDLMPWGKGRRRLLLFNECYAATAILACSKDWLIVSIAAVCLNESHGNDLIIAVKSGVVPWIFHYGSYCCLEVPLFDLENIAESLEIDIHPPHEDSALLIYNPADS
jgi:hypothetical protein